MDFRDHSFFSLLFYTYFILILILIHIPLWRFKSKNYNPLRAKKTLRVAGYEQQQQQQNLKNRQTLAKNYKTIGRVHFIDETSSSAVQQTTLEGSTTEPENSNKKLDL